MASYQTRLQSAFKTLHGRKVIVTLVAVTFTCLYIQECTPTGAQSLSAIDNKACIRPHRLDDTSDTLAKICQTQAMLELYASTIEKIGVEDTLPLYVASGLLTYQGNQGVFYSMQGGAEAIKHFSSSCCR